jgi:hypothetical protein
MARGRSALFSASQRVAELLPPTTGGERTRELALERGLPPELMLPGGRDAWLCEMRKASLRCYRGGMAVNRAITLRLETDDYERLEAEARRLGMGPGTLARVYVRGALGMNADNERQQAGLRALAGLATLRDELRRSGHAGADVVTAVTAARRELDGRQAS